MSGESIPRPAPSRRGVLGIGVAFPMTMYLAVTLGFDSSYSHLEYVRRLFVGLYEHGVYRSRVVGTYLVLALGHVLNGAGVSIHSFAAPYGQRSSLFTAVFVVNGVAYLGLALLLFLVTVSGRQWWPPFFVLVVLIAASSYVVTPYDDLSYLVVAMAVIVALRSRPWSWVFCLLLAVLGTATRESFFIAVAAAAAAIAADRDKPHGDRALAFMALVLGSFATYAVLRVTLAAAGGPHLWSPVGLSGNWNMSSAIAVLMSVGALLALNASFPDLVDLDAAAWYERSVRWLWAFSLPYIIVIAVGSVWFEALRLLVPIPLCQYLLRWRAEEWRITAGGAASSSGRAGDF